MDEAEVARHLKELGELLLETNRLQQQQFAFLQGIPPAPAPRVPRPGSRPTHRGPTNPLHQTWRGFVLDLQKLEAHARRERLKLTRGNVARFGVDDARTIARTMTWYGLKPTEWPPSTWDPDEPREGGAGTKKP
jgi:hypothetical protein